MATPSVSFRISRSTEDLAGTLHLLSQRLVLLEQRLEALEGQRRSAEEPNPALDESLGNTERLLLDCRALLGGALDDTNADPITPATSLTAAAVAHATWSGEQAEAVTTESLDGFDADEDLEIDTGSDESMPEEDGIAA